MQKYFIHDPFRKLWPGGSDYSFSVDSEGIVLADYSESNDRAHGASRQYHPTAISAYALSQHSMFMDTQTSEFRESFLKSADWLVHNLTQKDGFAGWDFHFAWESPGYRCKPPWISSMAQGMAISVLVRACQLTGKACYSAAAEEALSAFEVPVHRDGLLRIDREGCYWYEGVPSPIGAQVLNEVIFALVGLYEVQAISSNAIAKDLFERGVATLRRHLKDFDLNLILFRWSRYDNKLLFYSGDKYHQIHLEQLQWLYQVTGDDFFAHYYRKWARWHDRYGSAGRFSSKYVFRLLWILANVTFLKFYTRYLQHDVSTGTVAPGLVGGYYRPSDIERFDFIANNIPENVTTVLDVGARDSHFMKVLEARGYVVTAVDISPSDAEVLRASATRLPFKDASFDLVTILEVLEHLNDQELAQATAELTRVARQSVIVSIPNSEVPLGAGHKQRFNTSRVQRLFKSATARMCLFGKRPAIFGVRKQLYRISPLLMYAFNLAFGDKRRPMDNWIIGVFELTERNEKIP